MALNTYRLGEPEDLNQAVFMSIGAASVCWESMSGTGVFDDQRARQVGEELVAYIEDHFNPKTPDEIREAKQRRDPGHPPIPGL